MKTYNTDGTYLQMQDSAELRKKYYVKEGDGAYPQLLLQGIVQQGTGQIVCFEIGTRHQSELGLLAKQIGQLPQGSLLLADDLYNSYAIFAMAQRQGCHIIVPGKRERAYKVIEKIAEGDEIVELSRGGPTQMVAAGLGIAQKTAHAQDQFPVALRRKNGMGTVYHITG